MNTKRTSPLIAVFLAAAFFAAAPPSLRAEDFLIHVSLLKGIESDAASARAADLVVATYSLAGLRPGGPAAAGAAPAGPTGPDFRDELASVYRLTSVESLAESTWGWSGAPEGLGGFIMFGRETFRLRVEPAFVPPRKMKLHVAVSRPTGRARAEEDILTTELVASLDDPVVAGFMAGGRSYFLSLLVTRDSRGSAAGAAATAPAGEAVKGPSPALRPAHTVPFAFPENLVAGKIEGDVILQVSVDASGKVADVRVLRSLQPDLDEAAARTVRQWTFEPAEGREDRGPSTFGMSFRFTRRVLEPPAEPGEEPEPEPAVSLPPPVPASGELGSVLGSCADYCRELSAAALDFVCEERISEEIYDYLLTYGAGLNADSPTGVSRRVRKNDLLYDFQLVQGPQGVRENRTLLEENGRKTNEKNAALKTRRFFSYRSIYGPVGLFSRDRWPLFDYRLAGKDTVSGRPAWVIDVAPKPGLDLHVTYGRAWVDRETRRILKIEVATDALVGFDRLKEASDLSEVRPVFTTIHLYGTEKNGVMFPSRTVFREAYMTASGRRVQRSKTEITFANYRFFTVSVETSVNR